ncbi:Uncharacterised protein [Salmonella enterica subsp. enterica serovar Typhi]|nr:Uncharacterised protein [Salmonella enterica subsp. enterica serovar Typhi]
MPHRVEQCRRAAAHAALRAGFHRRLEVLVERNTAGVERLAATNRATQRTNAASVDADTGALGNVFHNRAGGGVDGIQTVATLDQYAGAELTGRGTHAGHDGRRQRDFERRDRIVKTFYIVKTRFTRIVREQAGHYQNVEELRAFIDFAGHAVLHQIFPFQLLNGSVGEGHIAIVNDKRIHLLELFFRVVFQQMIVVFAKLNHFYHMVVKCGRLKLAEGFLTQVENRQTRSQVLIIRRIARDQVCGGLNDSFMDIGGLNPIIKLNMRA